MPTGHNENGSANPGFTGHHLLFYVRDGFLSLERSSAGSLVLRVVYNNKIPTSTEYSTANTHSEKRRILVTSISALKIPFLLTPSCILVRTALRKNRTKSLIMLNSITYRNRHLLSQRSGFRGVNDVPIRMISEIPSTVSYSTPVRLSKGRRSRDATISLISRYELNPPSMVSSGQPPKDEKPED